MMDDLLESDALSSREYRRYSRQIILPEIGIEGQQSLKKKKVLVVGAGGLGSPVLQYLVAAGVGTIGIMDFDIVEASNLHRQVLFSISDLNCFKADVAKQCLRKQNPDVRIDAFNERLSPESALKRFPQYDLIIDCTDNFPTRYLINDACLLVSRPYIHASIFQFEGMLSVFADENGPCYRCLYPEPPPRGLVPSCAEGGVLGILPGILGTLQAAEAIKRLLGIGDVLIGRMLQVDVKTMIFRKLELSKDPQCPACSAINKINLEHSQINEACHPFDNQSSISAKKLEQLLQVDKSTVKVIDIRTDRERNVAKIDAGTHIPLSQLEDHTDKLSKEGMLVFYCLSGQRSIRAVELLQSKGFNNAMSLRGGILAWNSLESESSNVTS